MTSLALARRTVLHAGRKAKASCVKWQGYLLRARSARAQAVQRAVEGSEWRVDRRDALLVGLSAMLTGLAGGAANAEQQPVDDVEYLAAAAIEAYSQQQLPKALSLYNRVIEMDSNNPVWLERRGQVHTDMKAFVAAIDDFNRAEGMEDYASLGLLSNRALAKEGLYRWEDALADYNRAVDLASGAGYSVPYVLNSRGNCHGSMAAAAADAAQQELQWQLALRDYQSSTRAFQQARNLSGAIFAASNAALVWAQLGDDSRALKELRAVARRAPGSIDMRAALAALLWARGEEAAAEDLWDWACERINSGQLVEGGPVLDSCTLYSNPDWLARIRRWPPVMVERMQAFLQLRQSRVPRDQAALAARIA